MNLGNGSIVRSDEVSSAPVGKSTVERPPKTLLKNTAAAVTQQLIDDLPEQVAVLDKDFVIVALNRPWAEAMATYGYPGSKAGGNYRDVCKEVAATGYEPAIKVLAALDQIQAGTRDYWQLIFNGRGEWSTCQYQLSFHRITVGTQSFITVTRFDLTEILELRRLRDAFAKSFSEGQTAERERFGRELHDSTSQQLTAIGLMLGRLRRTSPGPEASMLIDEIEDAVREMQKEIRSISYVARPPALQQSGLADAVKRLVEGLARRSGLEASFEIQGDFPHLSEEVESAFYRVSQEALANVHRHAQATQVRVLLKRRRSTVYVLIADNGVGIAAETLAGSGDAGVGLMSIRSRMTELGGRLTIRPRSPGTIIMATLQV